MITSHDVSREAGGPPSFPTEICTGLSSLPTVAVPAVEAYGNPAQAKKHIRQAVSVRYTTARRGFMHGALVDIDGQSYVLAGASGSGKSGYAHHLGDSLGAETVANDWVALEREGGNFFASGLDWRESLKRSERQPLAGVIFLTMQDTHGRDAFIPNAGEFRQLVGEAFDTANPDELTKLRSFWTTNREALPFHCAVPVRRATEPYTAGTIAQVIGKSRAPQQAEVGIIGVGEVGSALAFQLGQLATVSKVHLFSRSLDRVIGVALDMNQATGDDVFVPHASAAEVLAASTATFLTLRVNGQPPTRAGKRADLPERWQKLLPNLSAIREIAEAADEVRYEGALFSITNPVDILTYATHSLTQNGRNPLRTYQAYGIGLGVDVSRACFYAKMLDLPLNVDTMLVYGNHSDTVAFETALTNTQNESLVRAVHRASEEVRSHGHRTVYAPVAAAIGAFRAYTEGGAAHLTNVQDGAFIGRQIRFRHGLPMLPEVTFSKVYDKLLASNQAAVDTYRDVL
jgi:malate/lactate dehydrogenase